MIALLKKLMARNGKGYQFFHDGGAAPVSRRFIYDEFHKALERVGIGKTEIQRRGLSIHSWRHFLNTELQVQGLTLQQVQAVTGHKSEGMTDNYSHLDPADRQRNRSAKRDSERQKAGRRRKRRDWNENRTA
jgi:integrase